MPVTMELTAADVSVEEAAGVATNVPTTRDHQPKRLATPKKKGSKMLQLRRDQSQKLGIAMSIVKRRTEEG